MKCECSKCGISPSGYKMVSAKTRRVHMESDKWDEIIAEESYGPPTIVEYDGNNEPILYHENGTRYGESDYYEDDQDSVEYDANNEPIYRRNRYEQLDYWNSEEDEDDYDNSFI